MDDEYKVGRGTKLFRLKGGEEGAKADETTSPQTPSASLSAQQDEGGNDTKKQKNPSASGTKKKSSGFTFQEASVTARKPTIAGELRAGRVPPVEIIGRARPYKVRRDD